MTVRPILAGIGVGSLIGYLWATTRPGARQKREAAVMTDMTDELSPGCIEVDGMQVGFGEPNEWRLFVRRHRGFMERIEALAEALQGVFSGPLPKDEKGDMVIFSLGRLCASAFFEAVLLCGNGHGTGALRTVRLMFEQLVTAAYLIEHPDESESFVDYSAVHQEKLVPHTNVCTIQPQQVGRAVGRGCGCARAS